MLLPTAAFRSHWSLLSSLASCAWLYPALAKLSRGSCLALVALLLALLGGCSSGNGTVTKTILLQGNAAHRAAILAGYQSFAAGVAYPFNALKIAAPTGSTIKSSKAAMAAGTSPLILTRRLLTASKTRATRDTTLTLIPALNLYVGSPTGDANVIALNYFSDAAGTQPAGSITITLPPGLTDTNYTSYPVKIPIVINLTAGNLPCNGTVNVTFTGATGKNTLTGTLTLPKNNTVFTIDLALDDAGNVSGSITGQENGATIRLTNCTGPLFGTLNCDLEIDPYGWKGTAMGSLLTGQFSTSVNTSTGISSSTVDAAGNLVITYPNKTTETVTNPLVATLIAGSSTTNTGSTTTTSTGTTGTGTTSTGTTGTGTGSTGSTGTGSGGTTGTGTTGGTGSTGTGTANPTYNAPVSLGAITPYNLNNAGQIVGITTDTSLAPVYLASASAAAQKLQGVTGPYVQPFPTYQNLAINNNGQIVGFGGSNLASQFWSSATAMPQTLTGSGATGYALNDSGLIVGLTSGYQGNVSPQTWSNPTTPAALAQPATAFETYARSVSANGQIAGISNVSNQLIPVYWSSTTATPQLLAAPPVSNYYSAISVYVNNGGQVCGSFSNGIEQSVYWASATATPQILPDLGRTFSEVDAINAGGAMVGYSIASGSTGVSQGAHAVIWTDPKTIQDLNNLIPLNTGWTLTNANCINDKGVIVGVGTQTVNGTTQTVGFYLTPIAASKKVSAPAPGIRAIR